MGIWSLHKYQMSLTFGLVGMSLSTVCYAQDSENLFDLPLEELLKVNISTNRAPATSKALPFKVTLITEQQIRRQLAMGHDTAQVLANLIPSFSPSRQKMSGLGETLRGGAPLFMIDGIPQSTPLRDASRDGYVIDLEMVKSIEVIYGANAMQGMGATGGIINFITHDTTAKSESSTAVMSALSVTDSPSQETSSYKLGLQHKQQLGALSLLIAGTLEERGLFTDGRGQLVGLEQVQGDIEDTQSHDLMLKATYDWQQQQIQLTFNDFYQFSHGDYLAVPGNINTGILTSLIAGKIVGEAPGNRVKNAAVDYHHDQIWGGELSAKLFWQSFAATFGATNTAIFQDPTLGTNIYDQSQIRSDRQGAKFSYYKPQLIDLPVDFTVGVDLLDDKNIQSLLLTKRVWSPQMHFRSWSPFVQVNYHATEKLTLNASLRRDMAELSIDDYRTIATSKNTLVGGGQLEFGKNLYNLGAIYQFNDYWSLIFNDGEGFGMPDAGRELRAINKPDLHVKDIFEISPLITENRELGVYYASSILQGQLSYFESTTDHGTQLQLINSVYRLDRSPSKTYGWEISGRWQVSEQTHLGLMYSNIRGRYDSNGDRRFDSDLTALDIPPARLGVNWTQQWSQGWSSHLQWYRDFSREFKTLNTTTASFAGYNLLDATITQQSSWGNFSLGIANLFNTQYTTYFTQVVQRNDRFFAGHGRYYRLEYRMHF